ncbi:MAG: hypothetical protein ABSB74_05740 [Tepidisphaeraceae bacterium]
MKTFLCATAAAALLMIPGISAASSLDYVQSGSKYTVLFDPNGCGTDNLPPSFYYRSYDCRIGSKPVVVSDVHVVTAPPNTGGTTPPGTGGTTGSNTGGTTPPDTGGTTPTGTTGPTLPPVITGNGGGGSSPVVPLPASSEMAGVGLAVIALATWHRARRLARA